MKAGLAWACVALLGLCGLLLQAGPPARPASAAAPAVVTPSPTLPPALPVLPATFYGVLTLPGGPAPDGTAIQVLVGGVPRATTTVLSGGLYTVDISGTGTDNNAVVAFAVTGYTIAETGVWISGAVTQLGLTAQPGSTATTIAQNTATAVAAATNTAVANATATAAAPRRLFLPVILANGP